MAEENSTEKDVAEEIKEETTEQEQTAAPEETPEETPKAPEKKKKEKKNKKDEMISDLNDRLLRNMAEFDNFRKRSEKEKAMMFEIGAKSVIEKILPVVDNFERGIAAISEEEKDLEFVKGMEQVYRQMVSSLEEIGVKPIDAVGNEFDPNLHNAVMHAEDEAYGTNIVSDELQKGYMYKESVVRHSMVKVVN